MSKTENTKPTITQKIDQLNQAVEWFYSDDFSLENATEKYQAAIALATEIEKDLKDLKNKITVLDQDFTKA